MLKHCLIFVIVLSSVLLPPVSFVQVTPAITFEVFSEDASPVIESQLKMDLVNIEPGNILSVEKSVSAVLEFANELTLPEIRHIESLGIRFARQSSSVVHIGRIYSANVASIDSLNHLGELGLLRATSGSKQFFPSLSTSVPLIGSPDVWNNLEKDGDAIDGSGVTIAILDTGVAWLHPSFWRQSSSEINVIEDSGSYYADLDNDSIPDANEGPINCIEGANPSEIQLSTDYLYIDADNNDRFDYGSGDRWLGGVDSNDNGLITLPDEDVVVLGESKVSFLYDQENDAVYVRGQNLTTHALFVNDYHGHGSHVASTALGGQPGFTSMIGAAPGADLIVIKSPLDSSDVLDGIYFAIQHGADIINMSFSSYLGFLDGTDLEDLAVNEALRKNGTLTTLAAGNLGGRNKHAHFEVPSGGTAGPSLSVHSPSLYSYLNVLWHSNDDSEHVLLTPPGEDPIDLGAFNDIEGTSWAVSHPDLNAYIFADESDKGLNRVVVQISTEDHNWTSGTWTVTLENENGASIWVDAYVWDNSWTGSALRFASHTTSQRTISSPGTADLGIVVTSYDEASHSISSSSSRGPRIDGVPMPVVIAPGVGIRAASRSTSSLWISRSGTSMASPHVAGVLALIRQASGSDNGWLDYSALIQGAGGQNNHHSAYDPSYGYGLCDARWSVQHVLDLIISESNLGDLIGISPISQDAANLMIVSGLDILQAHHYSSLQSLILAVTMRGEVDFTGDNVLSLEWDTDDNPSSGLNGVDVIVNVTGASISIYDWVSDHFETSSLSGEYWNSTSTVFVAVSRPQTNEYGKIGISTHNETTSHQDSISDLTPENQWLPLIDSLSVEKSGEAYSFNVSVYDRDTDLSSLSISWDVVSGNLSSAFTDSLTGSSTAIFSVDPTDYEISEVLSTILEVTAGSDNLLLPPIALSVGLELVLEIISAEIDQDIIRVGPLIEEHLTGQIIVDGYTLADSVKLAISTFYGAFLNFSLSGDEGVYSIDISLAAFSAGRYDLYAVAEDRFGLITELQFASVEIVEDYSVLLLIAGGGGAIIIGVIFFTRIVQNRKRSL